MKETLAGILIGIFLNTAFNFARCVYEIKETNTKLDSILVDLERIDAALHRK